MQGELKCPRIENRPVLDRTAPLKPHRLLKPLLPLKSHRSLKSHPFWKRRLALGVQGDAESFRYAAASRPPCYSLECVEEEFCEVRGYKLPCPAPALYQSGRGRATFSPPPRSYCCICCENLMQAVATCYGLDFREFLHFPTPFP
jgi:hypothetical protein